MMKPDEVKELIELLDEFIVKGDLEAIKSVEEKEFDKLMQHVYEGGTYDFKKFEDSKKKLDADIKKAEARAKYSTNKEYQNIINNAKETKKKLDEMKKKIENLKDKAIEIEINNAAKDFEITDFKDYENTQIKNKNEELDDVSKEYESYQDIADKIDKDGKFKDYLDAEELKNFVTEYNNLVNDLMAENKKPEEEKNKTKIEKLKEKIQEAKGKIEKKDIKSIIGDKVAESIKTELDGGKKVSVVDINQHCIEVEKNINKEKILSEIKSNLEISKDFLEIYNKERKTAVTDISKIDFKDIKTEQILQIRKNIFTKTNELNRKKKIIEKEIAAKQSTISQIDKATILKDNNKSDLELWKNYATGEQKNAIELYRNNFGSRFKFWRQSSNIFSAFFKSFNKNKTVFAAKHQQVEKLKNDADSFKTSLSNKFKESLKTHINKNNVKVKEADMRDVFRNMEEQDKEER